MPNYESLLLGGKVKKSMMKNKKEECPSSSESDEDWHERHHNNDEYESQQYGQHSFQSQQRYQQNHQHQQLPIQIYMQPNQNYFPSDKQSREDAGWRRRRAELQQSPQTPYYENQFNRDDTHW